MQTKTYNQKKIESKWSKIWDKEKIFKVDVEKANKPFYNLAMFPYPSAEGLHVGHIIPYSGVDTYGRYLRMNGHDVFEPMGFDAFGIHSENFAIKKGIHPKTLIAKTTKYFREKQMKRLGTLFDWDREVNTTDPDYYKWTQWIFIQMFKHGLAEKKKAAVTYCPSCKTVLSDEQTEIKKTSPQPSPTRRGSKNNSHLLSGEGQGEVKVVAGPVEQSVTVCERCKTPIERKELEQWFFKITKYADRLLSNLNHLDPDAFGKGKQVSQKDQENGINWSEKTKNTQREWIGKQEGVEIQFTIFPPKADPPWVDNLQFTNNKITVFTKFPETVFGVTYIVVAPEYKLIKEILSSKEKIPGFEYDNVQKYIEVTKAKTEQERIAEGKVKTGVFTGLFVINPVNNNKVPIWVADYVLANYGTGAVMGVPAHDFRDFAFAKEYNLPIIRVVGKTPEDNSEIKEEKDVIENGFLVNSDQFNGLKTPGEGKEKLIDWMVQKKYASRKTIFRLRDWCISRQRYWGPPIPMIFCKHCAEKGISSLSYHYCHPEEPGGAGDEGSLANARSSNKLRDSSPAAGGIGMTKEEMPGWFPVPEESLPVVLPYVKDYKPTGDGKSPLAKDKKWMKVKCPNCREEAERETDVSDTFLDSAWYFLRYPSVEKMGPNMFTDKDKMGGSCRGTPVERPQSEQSEARTSDGGKQLTGPIDFPYNPQITKKWLPVDMYIGGHEHAVLHLMYSRFVTMALKDMGFIDFEEPFVRFFAHGLMLSEGAKMSKSKGNVVNPNEYLDKYGADTLRLYILFMGPYDAGGDFRTAGIAGMHRFLGRIWNLVTSTKDIAVTTEELTKKLKMIEHKTIKKVGEDLAGLRFNTAIASLMEYYNALSDIEKQAVRKQNFHCADWESAIKTLLLLLSPFAPFIAEELWQEELKIKNLKLKIMDSIHNQPWPQFDPVYLIEDQTTIVVQVNGKVREKIQVETSKSNDKQEVEKMVLENPRIKELLNGKTPKNLIFVPGKLVNVVV